MNEINVQVVTAKFPSLSKHVAKLIEIYCALCPYITTNGDRSTDGDCGDNSTSADVIRKYLHRIGRPISTRYDMWCHFTWCAIQKFMRSQFLDTSVISHTNLEQNVKLKSRQQYLYTVMC